MSLSKQDTAVLKGIAICAMLCHHLYGFPPEGVSPYPEPLHWIGVLGKICVALFLFCSGYGLTANYTPISIKEDLKFIGRRLVKFYLNYWVIFLIFVPITIFCFHRSLAIAYGEEQTIGHLILDIFGLQGCNSYNTTWWFNTLIIFFYLLFPLLYRLVRIKPWVAVLVGMAIMRLSHRLPNPLEICTFQFPFLLGMVWQFYEDKGKRIEEWFRSHTVLSISLSLVLLAVSIYICMVPIIPHWYWMRIHGFIVVAIVLCMITILRKSQHLMSALAFFGKHSMNIYMTHTFLNAYWFSLWLHTGECMRGGGNFAILMILCLIISISIEYIKQKIGFYQLMKKITH